ncbi:MAG: DUF997 family protein [Lachnospiraceae bacterium]|nr:DUF997 family protein [Lachnospiraceae bacterium]
MKETNEIVEMSEEEKHKQMLKEIKATFFLILIVAAWHIGFGFGLNGIDIIILGMPLWFVVSTIGAFIISVVGVIILLKFVFVNFELGEETEKDEDQITTDDISEITQKGGESYE